MLPRLSTEDHLMTQQDFYYELQKETLNNQRLYLCNHVEPEKLFPYLQSRNCLSIDDCEQIRALNTTKSQVNKLVDILIKCGPDCLFRLIKAIKKNSKTQLFVVEKLLKDYQNRTSKEENRKKLAEILRNNEIGSAASNSPSYAPPPYTPLPSEIPSSLITSHSERLSPPSFQPNPSEVMRPSILRPFSRMPVTQEWPSTPSSCVTSHFMEGVETFHSSDYPRECIPPPYVFDQNEKLNGYNQENSTVQDSYSEGFEAVRRTSEPLRRQLRHQRRLPDEHDSSVTEVKQIRANIAAASDSVALRNVVSETSVGSQTPANLTHALDSGVSANSSFTLFHPPSDESFEVSGDVSPSLYLSS